MTIKLWLLLASIFATHFALGVCLPPQDTLRPVDPAISQLAAGIAQPLQKAHVTKVIVADLKGPDGQSHPVGKWLADQISDSLETDFPGLEVIPRPTGPSITDSASSADNASEAEHNAIEWASGLGANVVITGSFAKVPQGIGVSLSAKQASKSPQFLSRADGLVVISDEIMALSTEPIPSMKAGIARAGVAGTSIPVCIHCPAPAYSQQARDAKYQGSVVLQVTVTTDGRATNIAIVKDPGTGLGLQAIESVRKWKFKPAVGPDGKPAAVICPIEVTFQLY